MKEKYPYNLLARVFGKEDFGVQLTVEQTEALPFVINTLSERMQKIITYKYVMNLPVTDISLALGISKQAVANTNRKIIAKLQQPENATKIKYGLCGAAETDNDSIESLGLSIRTHNALKRGGIHKISEITSIQQLHLIRQIGKVAKKEILDKLSERGVILEKSIKKKEEKSDSGLFT